MQLSPDIFKQLEKPFPDDGKPPVQGAQRIGFDWYVFADVDALGRLIAMFDQEDCKTVCSKCHDMSDLEESNNDLQGEIDELEEKVEKLEDELNKLKKGKQPA